MQKHSILAVDNDPIMLQGIQHDLEREGYFVATAENGLMALEMLSHFSFDLVITDWVMEPINGLRILKTVKTYYLNTLVIILTGYGDLATAICALRLNADDFVLKASATLELSNRVRHCIEKLEHQKVIQIYNDQITLCTRCKRFRINGTNPDSPDAWITPEKWIWEKTDYRPTSTYCPTCYQMAMGELKNL